MAGYWLKLYTEILDDPKYFRLSDNAKLGMIELMVVAKRVDLDGEIPCIEDVAFYTRRTVEWWQPVFDELQKIEYLVFRDSELIIRTFSERQAPVGGAERIKQFRVKQHSNEFNNPCNEPVTNRYGDSETDSETEKIKDTSFEKPSKEEPILEPCNEDGVPDSWRDKPSKKLIIKENETRLASTISGLLGIKQPICNNKKDYASLSVTWWKPIKEMLRQVDGDVEKAERVVDDVIIAYRAANLTINSPKSLINGFIGELVKNNKRKIIGKTQDGEVIYG